MAGKKPPAAEFFQAKERLDKWLFQARFFRSRTLSVEVVEKGHCRVNGQRTSKPGYAIVVGDVLTFPQANRIRMVRIADLAEKRGSAGEAGRLYVDLDATPSQLE